MTNLWRKEFRQAAFSTMNLHKHVDDAKRTREMLEAIPSETPEQVRSKAALHIESEEAIGKLKAVADVLIATELIGLTGKKYERDLEEEADRVTACWTRGLGALLDYARERLNGRKTFHWPLEFPEIMERGGFNAIIGNPPYLGGKKITTSFGVPFRDFIIRHIALGRKGHADLCAYFVLRADQLLRSDATVGFVVSSAIAEADTREVGLDWLVDSGRIVYRASTNEVWPGAASVVYSSIWITRTKWIGPSVLNGDEVPSISSFLSDRIASGKPYRLRANSELSFLGSYVGGMGFVITPAEAQGLIETGERNREVLFPYLTGTDVNSSPSHSGQSWIINFFDWPLNRDQAPKLYCGPVAADFPECLKTIEERVKPERTRRDANGDYVLRKPLPQKWWIYGDKRPALYKKLQSLQWSMAIAKQATKYVEFGIVGNNCVFSHALAIIASDSFGVYAALTSSFHKVWVREYCSYNLALLRYSPTDVFDTFALPASIEALVDIGKSYHEHLRHVMATRNEGLTTTFNRFHDPDESAPDIQHLRELHSEMDHAVANAYIWPDLVLGHGFHSTKEGLRYTINEVARIEILDRLLALNHARHAEEQAEDKLPCTQSTRTVRRRGKAESDGRPIENGLFSEEGVDA